MRNFANNLDYCFLLTFYYFILC